MLQSIMRISENSRICVLPELFLREISKIGLRHDVIKPFKKFSRIPLIPVQSIFWTASCINFYSKIDPSKNDQKTALFRFLNKIQPKCKKTRLL